MKGTLQKSGEFDIKKEVIDKVRNLKFEFNEEALFFLDLVIEKNVLRKKTLYGPMRDNRTGRYTGTGGLARKQPGRAFRVSQVRMARINKSINVFAETLVQNSDRGVVTPKSLYITMKGICPLWPFC